MGLVSVVGVGGVVTAVTVGLTRSITVDASLDESLSFPAASVAVTTAPTTSPSSQLVTSTEHDVSVTGIGDCATLFLLGLSVYSAASETAVQVNITVSTFVHCGRASIVGEIGFAVSITTCPVALLALSLPTASSAVTCSSWRPSASTIGP